MNESAAAAALVSEQLQVEGMPIIVVKNVRDAFATVVAQFRKQWPPAHVGISPQAYVSPTARIASDVDIHPMAYVGDEVTIGSGTIVHPGVRILAGCTIGENNELFPNSVLYENTVIGDRCLIHATAVIGAYGFGYSMANGQHIKCAQLGNVVIQNDVEVGAGTTIDRGSYGSTVIGSGTKLDNLVMIGHNCKVGRHNLLCAQSGIAGSATTGDYAVMAGQSALRDHIHLGTRSVVGGKAGVKNNVPDGIRVFGVPAVTEREFAQMQVNHNSIPKMRKQLKLLVKQLAEMEAALEQKDRSAAA